MKIVLACGGTGGHIFPAFSVAEELKKRNPSVEIVYVCGNMDIESAIFKIIRGERVFSVTSAAFRGGRSLLDIRFLIKLFKGLSASFWFLKKEKPALVVGFGGYFSFPMVFTARLLGIRAMVHEQNVIPGVANKILAKMVNGVALSFEDTLSYFNDKHNLRVTGNPIRSSIENASQKDALQFFGFSPDKKTLLVLGGSQGAESINTLFIDALSYLEPEFKSKLQVLHLCGKMNPAESEAAFKRHGILAKSFSFFERMDLAYGASSAAIGRAGATFLAEIQARKIPAILIPYPYSNGHQSKNAESYSRTDRAIVAEQFGLSSQKLAEHVKSIVALSDEQGSKTMPSVSARARLADYIEETVGV